MLDFENPWVLAVVMAIIGVVAFGLIEVVLFDGDLLGAVVRGFVSGLAFALVFTYIRRATSE
jgi:ABC-type thiamin/hydroxymethylpyrimidine transport system permease subunit